MSMCVCMLYVVCICVLHVCMCVACMHMCVLLVCMCVFIDAFFGHHTTDKSVVCASVQGDQ